MALSKALKIFKYVYMKVWVKNSILASLKLKVSLRIFWNWRLISGQLYFALPPSSLIQTSHKAYDYEWKPGEYGKASKMHNETFKMIEIPLNPLEW